MFAELRTWPARRRMIAAGVAIVAFAVVVLASGILGVVDGVLSFPCPWWAYLAVAAGAGLVGLVVASYIGTPIGADATLCDTRWPVFGLIALYLATDLRTAAPMVTGIARPAVAVAALALLVWALLERLASERRAVARLDRASPGQVDGDVCTTCRPLFSRPASAPRAPRDVDHPDLAS